VRLGNVKTGDIVLVNDGLSYYALVQSPPKDRRVTVQALCRRQDGTSKIVRTVKATDIEARWSRRTS
jgi:hypothetical protein